MSVRITNAGKAMFMEAMEKCKPDFAQVKVQSWSVEDMTKSWWDRVRGKTSWKLDEVRADIQLCRYVNHPKKKYAIVAEIPLGNIIDAPHVHLPIDLDLSVTATITQGNEDRLYDSAGGTPLPPPSELGRRLLRGSDKE